MFSDEGLGWGPVSPRIDLGLNGQTKGRNPDIKFFFTEQLLGGFMDFQEKKRKQTVDVNLSKPVYKSTRLKDKEVDFLPHYY